MKAHEIIENLENHCGEKLNCSRRLRFQLEETIQRMIDEKQSIQTNILNVLNGFQTFDPGKQTTVKKRK